MCAVVFSASTILITTIGANCTQRVVIATEHTYCDFTFLLTYFTFIFDRNKNCLLLAILLK